jgi:hypothetical protein
MSLFTTNIGPAERIVRAVLGVGILSLAFVGPRTPWAYLGIIPLLTALLGWCPLYRLMGFSTLRKKAA